MKLKHDKLLSNVAFDFNPRRYSLVCNRVMSLTSVAFVGHMGPLPLAGAALATTLGNVTGNSIMVGRCRLTPG